MNTSTGEVLPNQFIMELKESGLVLNRKSQRRETFLMEWNFISSQEPPIFEPGNQCRP